jgi:hypothetical protein
LEVEVYDGDKLIGTASADQLRNDLIGAGKGDGRHAFVFNTPQELHDGKNHSISVRFKGSTKELQNSPKTLACKQG